ncbi:MAG: single-stranded DNA-binding protein [Oscillospiraceae bacterium]|nr:single-stranded DNA-binding protein [Ruminococcus sp.]MBQ7013425.1 single-stranded DNA-binding protein [Oscillospiraceae bacterium]
MYNRVIIMGRLTADPELRQTQSGISMCRISVAVDRGFARQGEERKTDFFDVTLWRQQAEFVSRYFSKGRMIHIEGRLQNDNYTDQNGQKHYRTAIVADNVTFCGDKRADNGNNAQYIAPNQFNQQYSQPAPPVQTAPQAAVNRAPQPIELGDLGDFEEILSDGEVPF